jgi:hypothetical protein
MGFYKIITGCIDWFSRKNNLYCQSPKCGNKITEQAFCYDSLTGEVYCSTHCAEDGIRTKRGVSFELLLCDIKRINRKSALELLSHKTLKASRRS